MKMEGLYLEDLLNSTIAVHTFKRTNKNEINLQTMVLVAC